MKSIAKVRILFSLIGKTLHKYMDILVIGVVGLLVFIGLASLIEWLASSFIDGDEINRAKAVSVARTSLIQLLGGVALAGGLFFTGRTYLLARATNITDLFSKAMDQIGDRKNTSVRCGGLHTLGMLAHENSRYWPAVEEILCTYSKEYSSGDDDEVQPDVQIALNILGGRKGRENESWSALDLRNIHAPKAQLVGINFSHARLSGANFECADFTDASLIGTELDGAFLKGIILTGSRARAADFRRSNLSGADFLSADLSNVELAECTMEGVKNLTEEQLQKVNSRPSSLSAG
ncbi:pentapeptide repeat-containing protein [Arthrobacter psychrochitiniphilus]|uniref:Pentapeptide repeat-containing protein n=1 Tax=Arthrobacter psychrochitiniphilus TaxID=291045 RepID=A0A2V3DN97_9MICC|nr:pentapeptide repeat-containing protein [Arthrobacter psychrochitiniphilus]NYG16078.1 hypothetical protein [Arthrobacter psychrochitiniphilus]PXA63959.1 hypothetical protein CVS29_17750 [Arthrobacter psychrochitiniphilus]